MNRAERLELISQKIKQGNYPIVKLVDMLLELEEEAPYLKISSKNKIEQYPQERGLKLADRKDLDERDELIRERIVQLIEANPEIKAKKGKFWKFNKRAIVKIKDSDEWGVILARRWSPISLEHMRFFPTKYYTVMLKEQYDILDKKDFLNKTYTLKYIKLECKEQSLQESIGS